MSEKYDIPTLMGTEEAIAKVLQHMTEEDKIFLFSELSDEEIHDITVTLTVGDQLKKITGSTVLIDMVNNYLKLKVSRKRKGRQEVVDLITYQNLMGGTTRGKGSKISDLFGGLKI